MGKYSLFSFVDNIRCSAALTEGNTHGCPSVSRYAPTQTLTLSGRLDARNACAIPKMASGGPSGIPSQTFSIADVVVVVVVVVAGADNAVVTTTANEQYPMMRRNDDGVVERRSLMMVKLLNK